MYTRGQYYEASIMFKALAYTSYANQIIKFFFKGQSNALGYTQVLPFCNYYGNPAHKANECNIPSEDLFCDYCGKEGHQEAVCFAKFPKRKQLQLPQQNLPTSFDVPQPKAKAHQPSTQALPTKGNSNKNVKKKEHNADKREVLQAHAIQVQTHKMNSNH
jgi:hypothetical protein